MDLTGRRKNATRETTATLKAWLYEHRKNPYPTKSEKVYLAIITKMTLTQVSTWFANARRRLKKENKMTWSPRNRFDWNHFVKEFLFFFFFFVEIEEQLKTMTTIKMMMKIEMTKMKRHQLIFNVHRRWMINRFQQTNLNYFINISNLQHLQVGCSFPFKSMEFLRRFSSSRWSMWKWYFIWRENQNNEKKIWSNLVFSWYGREKWSKTNIFLFQWTFSTWKYFQRKTNVYKWKFRKLNFLSRKMISFSCQIFHFSSSSSSFNFPSNSIRFSFSHWI